MRKLLLASVVALALSFVAAPIANAAPLADNCTRDQGTVTCTSFEGPGNNQAGVGETTQTDTQGNTTNFSPEPQDPGSTTSCNPSSSQGRPCNP